jgi:hypothetical protein
MHTANYHRQQMSVQHSYIQMFRRWPAEDNPVEERVTGESTDNTPGKRSSVRKVFQELGDLERLLPRAIAVFKTVDRAQHYGPRPREALNGRHATIGR